MAAVPGLPLSECRALLGRSAVLWAGTDGVTVRPRSWIALSGANSVVYNAALVHGDGRELEITLDQVLGAGVPAVVSVAGPALGEVERLATRGWKCVGSTPLMVRELHDRPKPPPPPAPAARRLGPDDHPQVRALIGEAFGVGEELAGVGISGVVAGLEGHSLWGAFDGFGRLAACLAAVRMRNALVIWSMATASALRRRGFGAAVLLTVLADAAAAGVTVCLLSSSEEGEQLYRALGYRELERWQQWSRPRWALGRA